MMAIEAPTFEAPSEASDHPQEEERYDTTNSYHTPEEQRVIAMLEEDFQRVGGVEKYYEQELTTPVPRDYEQSLNDNPLEQPHPARGWVKMPISVPEVAPQSPAPEQEAPQDTPGFFRRMHTRFQKRRLLRRTNKEQAISKQEQARDVAATAAALYATERGYAEHWP